MALEFKRAVKQSAKLRMALIGISGTGKTYGALRLATGMGGKIAVIDTEHGRASRYAHKFTFDKLELDTFSPTTYIQAIQAAEQAGYDILIIDSLSHAWIGKDGALEQVDRAARAQRSQNTFTAWRDVTPLHNQLVEAITTSSLHVIATMRSKAKYDLEKDDRGKLVPRKIGMEPMQRDGLEYEFDLVGFLDYSHNYVISNSTLDSLHPMDVLPELSEDIGKHILADITGNGTLPERPASPSFSKSSKPLSSDLLQKRMWAVIKKHNVDQEQFRAWLKDFGHESTKTLTQENMEYIVALVEHNGASVFSKPLEVWGRHTDGADDILLPVGPGLEPGTSLEGEVQQTASSEIATAFFPDATAGPEAWHAASEFFSAVCKRHGLNMGKANRWLLERAKRDSHRDVLPDEFQEAIAAIETPAAEGGLADDVRAGLQQP